VYEGDVEKLGAVFHPTADLRSLENGKLRVLTLPAWLDWMKKQPSAKAEGKPEAALSKIVEGRVTGFYKGEVLVDQAFAKDSKKTVAQVLEEAGVKATAVTRFRVGN
jgi:translation elongation factor EF-Ts